MNNILLINRLDPFDHSNNKKKIFFQVGGMNITEIETNLANVLNKSNLVDKDEILYKYNGVELNIPVQKIPEINKLLALKGFLIYSVFEIYNPDS